MIARLTSVVLGAVLLTAAAVSGCSGGRDGETRESNVLLITLDTTRADRLGFYGYDKPTSPNLDALARESTVFDSAFAQATVTPVSHASILTGLEPYHHGLRVFHGLKENVLEDEQVTLAELWQALGWQTAAFVSAFPAAAAFGLDQGFELFDEDFPQSDGSGLVAWDGVVTTGMSQRRADATTGRALDWLRAAADPNEAAFIWVHYFDPHDPYVMPPKEERKELLGNEFRPASRHRADYLRALYDCEIRYMDEQIGRLLSEMKARGLWERTIIVVVADHGEGLGDHDWWSHGILYQEQIRVPLLVRVPGIDGGTRVESLVRTIDIMPTVLEAAGVGREAWPEMDGASFLEAMRTGKTREPRSVYSESLNMLKYGRLDVSGRFDDKDDKLYSVILDGHKFIYHQLRPEESELYDLRNDPEELKDLAAQRPGEADRLAKHLEGLAAFSDFMPGATPTDEERLEQLKSLGYTE